MRPQVGQLINNKYRLVRLIGDGGMGSVFEAQHEVLHTSVALKFLHPELSRRQGLVQRFLQEARVSAKIQSPHVVRVTDVEQTPNGLAFIVMEYLNGTSLQNLYEDLYKAGKRLAYDEAINYALQMLDGLEAAHDEGIVHRDLKPDNVMIVKGKKSEPLVKLLDFGIAKLKINGELYKGLTRPGVIMGTPEYMAPEQVFSADQVDGRADIFSCGVMFFEMLAGRRPVGGDEPHQIAAQYLAGSFAKLTDLAPHISSELAAIVHKAMAAEPKDRFATVAEFRAAMEPFSNKPVTASGGRSTPPPAAVPVTPHHVHAERDVSAHAAAHSPVAVSSGPLSSAPMIDGGATDKMSNPPSIPVSGTAKNGTSILQLSGNAQAFGATEDAFSNGGQSMRDSLAQAMAQVNGRLPGTEEAAPFFPGSTDGYDPNAMARPGGTNIGDVQYGGGHVIPSTAGYEPYQPPGQTPPFVGAVYAPQVQPRRKKGMGIVGILLAGLTVAGLAVGGVYAFNNYGQAPPKPAKTKVASKTPKTTEVNAPLPEQTQQPTPTPDPTQATPTPPTTETTAPTPPTTSTTVAHNPNPNPNPNPNTNPNPSPTTPSTSPIVLPSSLPGVEFPPGWFPGQSPTPTPTTNPTNNPTPNPTPTTNPTNNNGKPKTGPIRGDILRPKHSQNDTPPSTKPSTKPAKSTTTPVLSGKLRKL